jgi:nitrite reductase (NADH) small subunit
MRAVLKAEGVFREMSQFVRICSQAELPQVGFAKEFSVAGKVLCLANVNGAICATDNECPHHGGPLGEGYVEDGKIVCPWHSWAFDPITGEATHFPKAKVQVYEVSITNESVFVKL